MAKTTEKELTLTDSKMIQGMAALAMLCLHLFDRYDYYGLYSPFIFVKGLPLCFYFGQLSDFCVMGFAFCSGYAHMKLFESYHDYYPRRLKSLLRLIIQYWVVICVFSLVSIAVGQGERMPGDAATVFGNVFLYDISYCGAWWYMYVYVLLVILSPLLLRCTRKMNSALLLFLGFIIYCGAYYLRFHIQTTNLLVGKLGPFGMTLFEYMLGSVFYKEKWFSRGFAVWKRIKRELRIPFSCCIVVLLMLLRTLVVPNLFFAPVSGVIIITLFFFWEKPACIEKLFLFIGSHSTNIWLTHMFFYLYMFSNLVYIGKYPPVIFACLLGITIVVSGLLQLLQRPVVKWIK